MKSQKYTIEILDDEDCPHTARICVDEWDGMDEIDRLSEITEKAVQHASNNGYEYRAWEFIG